MFLQIIKKKHSGFHSFEWWTFEAFALFSTDSLTIVSLAPVSTRKDTSTPETCSLTRGSSSVFTALCITGWRVRSLAVEGAAGLWLASPAGSHSSTVVAFFLGNHAACGQCHQWSNLSYCPVHNHSQKDWIHHVVVKSCSCFARSLLTTCHSSLTCCWKLFLQGDMGAGALGQGGKTAFILEPGLMSMGYKGCRECFLQGLRLALRDTSLYLTLRKGIYKMAPN